MNWLISFIATIISAIMLGSAIAEENTYMILLTGGATIANMAFMLMFMGVAI
jgi:hypothetical protein